MTKRLQAMIVLFLIGHIIGTSIGYRNFKSQSLKDLKRAFDGVCVMSVPKNIVYISIVVMLLITLAACRQRGGAFEVRLAPKALVEVPGEAIEIRPALVAMLGYGERISLVQYISAACTTADGFGGPPKCAQGEMDGTIVEAFPVYEMEGYYVRPEHIADTFDFQVDRLFAVYRPAPGADPQEYWPTGKYALLFERQTDHISQPVTVYVTGGKIVRLGFSYGVDPSALLNQVPVERILFTPKEASALTAQLLNTQVVEPIELTMIPDAHPLSTPTPQPNPGNVASTSGLPGNGVVKGEICYPSQFIPEMTVYLEEMESGLITEVEIARNQRIFSTSLEPGMYSAYAYPDEMGNNPLGGAYTEFVVCGMGLECTDHALRIFEIRSGDTLNEIRVCDWYAIDMVPPRP